MSHLESAVPSADCYKSQLSRSLSFRENILITLSAVTPASSVFVIAPAVMQGVGGASVLAFIIGGIIGVTVALCYAELSSAFPISGGEYSFVARALGKVSGFMLFVLTLISNVCIVAVVACGAGTYLSVIISGANNEVIGVIVVLLATAIGCFSIRANAWVTGIFLALELAALAVLAVLGFSHTTQSIATLWTPQMLDSGNVLVSASAGTLIAYTSTALLAMNGYGAAVYFAEETRRATKTIGRAIMWSLVIAVTAEIVPITAVVLGTPDLQAMMASSDPLSYFIEQRGGTLLNAMVSIGIAVAIFNAVLAILLQCSRALFSSARDGSFPERIGRPLGSVNSKTKTPVIATVVTGTVAALLLAFVPFSVLLILSGAGVLIVYGFVAVAALSGRINGKTRHAAYKMPLWPIIPCLMLIVTLIVIYETLLQAWVPVVVAIIVAVIGLPYYFVYVHRHSDRWTLPGVTEAEEIVADADESDGIAPLGVPATG